MRLSIDYSIVCFKQEVAQSKILVFVLYYLTLVPASFIISVAFLMHSVYLVFKKLTGYFARMDIWRGHLPYLGKRLLSAQFFRLFSPLRSHLPEIPESIGKGIVLRVFPPLYHSHVIHDDVLKINDPVTVISGRFLAV